MRLDGSPAHAQLPGNLVIRAAVPDQRRYLAFAPRQAREASRLLLAQRDPPGQREHAIHPGAAFRLSSDLGGPREQLVASFVHARGRKLGFVVASVRGERHGERRLDTQREREAPDETRAASCARSSVWMADP